MGYVLRVSGFHIDAASRARHDRARFVLSTLGVPYTECTVNKACAPFPDGHELPQLCTQDESGSLTVIGGMDAIDDLNDSGFLKARADSLKAECEAFKSERRLEYAARAASAPKETKETKETKEAKETNEKELLREAKHQAETERSLRAKIETLERALAEAVRAAEHSHAEMEAMERNAARLERKLAHASRALESASGLFSTLVAFAHTADP